jgi:hypothetical protein
MVQRRPSIVVRSETLMELGFAHLFRAGGGGRASPPRLADRMLAGRDPFALLAEGLQSASTTKSARETPILRPHSPRRASPSTSARTTRADDARAAHRSGYYIDVGASTLVATARSGDRRRRDRRLTRTASASPRAAGWSAT